MTTTAHDLERLAAAPHGVRDPLPAFFLTATAGAGMRLVTRTASSPFGPRPVLCTALIARKPQGFSIATLATHGAN